jgi:hypothetical protein
MVIPEIMEMVVKMVKIMATQEVQAVLADLGRTRPTEREEKMPILSS